MHNEKSLSRRKFIKICTGSTILVPLLGTSCLNSNNPDPTKYTESETRTFLNRKLNSLLIYELKESNTEGFFEVPMSAVRTLTKNKKDRGWVFKKYVIDDEPCLEIVSVYCKRNNYNYLIKNAARVKQPKITLSGGDILYLDNNSFSFVNKKIYVNDIKKKCGLVKLNKSK